MSLSKWIQDIDLYLVAFDDITRFCVVGILSLVIVYYFMNAMIRQLRHDMRGLGRDVFSSAKEHYLRVAWIGWLFVAIGIALIEIVALKLWVFSDGKYTWLGMVGGFFLMLSGILFNLKNYCLFCVRAMRDHLK